MKYIKMLWLLAITAAALTAFAGTASATMLTATPVYTGPIQAVNETQLKLHGPSGSIVCNKSIIEGTIEAHGAGVSANAQVATLDFSECGSTHVTVVKGGTWEFSSTSTTGDGTLAWTGAEITFVQTTIFGAVHCIYGTSKTSLGTVTGASGSLNHATLHTSAKVPRVATNPLCGSEPAELTGNYKFTVPTGLQIH